MGLRVLFAPLYAAALGGLAVAAITWRARSSPRWVLALASAAVVATLWLAWLPAGGPGAWLSARSVATLVGWVLVVAAAVMALFGTRLRRRADLILSSAPVTLDEAVRAHRLGRGRPGVFSGRLAASDPVPSPGGVLGAFYDAQVRSFGTNGAKGALVSRETGRSPVVTLRGERTEATIALGSGSVLGPVQVRECCTGGSLRPDSPGAFIEGGPPADAASFERVGKVGERCLVVGRLEAGAVAGSYRLLGEGGNPVLVVLGQDGVPFGRAFAWKAWASFAAAAALCAASAACLALS